MDLWRYVLAADQKHDLAGAEQGLAWFNAQRRNKKVAKGPQTDSQRKEWTDCINALRSLAARLKGAKARRPTEDNPAIADGLVLRYLGQLAPTLEVQVNSEGERLPLPKRAGVRICFRSREVSRFPHEEWFRMVFASMFLPEIPPVCGTCGDDLPRTTGGKTSRRTTCKRCQQATAWAKKSAKVKRAVWKEQYRRKRSTERTETKTSSNAKKGK